MRKKVSSFPLDKPFERLPPGNQFDEIIFPLVVNFNSENALVVGTATVLCKHLLVTARHVIESVAKFACWPKTDIEPHSPDLLPFPFAPMAR